MRKLFLVLVMFSTFTNAQDYLSTSDFQINTYVGVFFGSFGSQMNETLNIDMPNSLAYIGSATAVGLVIGSYKAIEDGSFSVENLGATMFGGVASWALQEFLTYVFNIPPKLIRASLMAGSTIGLGLAIGLNK